MTTVERESTRPRESTLPYTHVVLGRRISRGVLLVVVGALWIFEISYVIGTVRPFLEPDGPDDAVLAYLTAISEGDATTANALVDPGVDEASATLLTDEALRGAVARPSAIVVDPETRTSYDEDESVTVSASYEIAGQRIDLQVDVERSADDTGTVAWRLVTPLVGEIDVRSYGARSATVAGVPVTLEPDADGVGRAVLPAYPGVYRLAGPDSAYASSVPIDVSVSGDPDGTSGALLVEDTAPALPAELDRLLTATADECLAGTWDRPADCATLIGYDPAVVAGYEPPVVGYASGGTFSAAGGTVTLNLPEYPGEPYTNSVSISGNYEIRDGTVIITRISW